MGEFLQIFYSFIFTWLDMLNSMSIFYLHRAPDGTFFLGATEAEACGCLNPKASLNVLEPRKRA